MRLLVNLLILVISVFVASYIIPGIRIDSSQTLFVVAILLGVINAFIKPILIVLTLPLTVLTLGLFLLILNGLLVVLVSNIVPGFHVDGILAAILFSLVVSITSSVLSNIA